MLPCEAFELATLSTTTLPSFITQRTPREEIVDACERIAVDGDEVGEIARRDSTQSIVDAEQRRRGCRCGAKRLRAASVPAFTNQPSSRVF